MSRRKRSKRRQSRSQQILWALSLVLVASMMLSLIIVALPSGPAPAPPPETGESPTAIQETLSSPTPSEELTPIEPLATRTPTATGPAMGPVLPTQAPTVAPTVAVTPTRTVTPTVAVPPTATGMPTAAVSPTSASQGRCFSVCGDSRDNPSVFSQILQAVAYDGCEFLVHVGDLVNEGTSEQWEEFRQIMEGFPLPFYPVPGNHDSLDGSLDGFLIYSGAPSAHYSFDWDSVHFSLVDSHNGGLIAAERDWLRDDLRATTQPVKMVFLHHPPFDPDGTDHTMAFGNEPFMELMVQEDVGFVFAGHIHAYAQQEQDGVVYTITGGAGAPLYGGEHPQAFHHYLRVTVQGSDVTIEVVRI